MGSLGVAECHFILEETGGWGAEFLSLHQLLSHAQFSSQCPSAQPPDPRPVFLQTPAQPSKPYSGTPPLLGGVP